MMVFVTESTCSPTQTDEPRKADPGGVRLDTLVDAAVRRIEARFASGPDDLTGVSDLDEQIGPLAAGKSLVISSDRPADATTLALQIAVRAALRGRPIVVASARLDTAVIAERVLSLATRIDGRHLLHGRLDQEAWWRLGRTVRRLQGLDVTVLDDASLRSLRRLKAPHADSSPTALVVVDGIEPLLRSDVAAVDELHKLVRGSAAGWVFTLRRPMDEASGSGDPTWSDELGCGLGNIGLAIERRHGEPFVLVEHGLGWVEELLLHQLPGGLGFHGRSDRRLHDDELPQDWMQ